jgi:predicted RNA-binding Zn ribbon-like protein
MSISLLGGILDRQDHGRGGAVARFAADENGATPTARLVAQERDETAEVFFFVGEALALDLVNTEIATRGKPVDLLDPPNALPAWWRAARARYPEADDTDGAADLAFADPRLLPAVKGLRAALRRLFGAIADRHPMPTADLAVLNGVLRAGSAQVEAGDDGRLRTVYRARDRAIDAALLPIARSATTVLTERDPARLHRCGNERCVLLFYDTTKSATRRWCSVGCMNRARSAARYRARKAASE